MSANIKLLSASPHKTGGKLLINDFEKLESIGVSCNMIMGNTEPLSKVYNSAILGTTGVDYLVLCHDDITILPYEDDFIKSIKIMQEGEYSIGGVAGTKECVIKEKNLWHIMNNVRPFHGASGEVRHYTNTQYDHYFNSRFGPFPERVILYDGVFLLIDVKRIKEKNIKFDESCPSPFHFYDLDFCLTANQNNLRMTTLPIKIVHASHGLSDIHDENWNNGNKWFKEKWGK